MKKHSYYNFDIIENTTPAASGREYIIKDEPGKTFPDYERAAAYLQRKYKLTYKQITRGGYIQERKKAL